MLQGFLTDFFTAVPEEYGSEPPDPEAPAFLLVHGFGAFGEQWRGQIRALAAAGHYVMFPPTKLPVCAAQISFKCTF